MNPEVDLIPRQILVDGRQAAAMLSISYAKLRELMIRGKIRSVKIDRVRRYRLTDLEAFAEQLENAS